MAAAVEAPPQAGAYGCHLRCCLPGCSRLCMASATPGSAAGPADGTQRAATTVNDVCYHARVFAPSKPACHPVAGAGRPGQARCQLAGGGFALPGPCTPARWPAMLPECSTTGPDMWCITLHGLLRLGMRCGEDSVVRLHRKVKPQLWTWLGRVLHCFWLQSGLVSGP